MQYIIDETGGDISVKKEGIYEFICLQNVVKIESKFNQWIIDTSKDQYENSVQTPVLIIDTISHSAFCHWVFESAIYLPFFKILKQNYPNLKLYLEEFKTYKKLFCDYLQIHPSDIIYELEPDNMCIFPLPISFLNINKLDHRWKIQFDYFIEQLTLSLENTNVKKKITNLFLPRQTKENYKANDRSYNTIDISNHLVKDTDHILHTDTITELKIQMELLNSSKNIIVTCGSPYIVNGLFCRNSNIIVLDHFILHQMKGYIKMKYIHDRICKHNRVVFIPNKNNNTFYYNDLVNELI
jgi:hypothetical protein